METLATQANLAQKLQLCLNGTLQTVSLFSHPQETKCHLQTQAPVRISFSLPTGTFQESSQYAKRDSSGPTMEHVYRPGYISDLLTKWGPKKCLGTVGLKLVQRRKEHKHKRNVWPCEPQEFKRGLGPFRHSLYICHCI